MPREPMTQAERRERQRQRVAKLIEHAERQIAAAWRGLSQPSLTYDQMRAHKRRAAYWTKRARGARAFLAQLTTPSPFGGEEA